MHMTSHVALPLLLAEVTSGAREPFDFIFIDGFHTFDYTLLDFFYADLLLKVNGVIMLDDIRHKAVADVVRYVEQNYDHYDYNRNNPAHETMGTFIKADVDHRTKGHPSTHKWGHHVGNFIPGSSKSKKINGW
jgi:predicted O-methyltransferase YrrM